MVTPSPIYKPMRARFAFLIALMVPLPASAQRPDPAREYELCMTVAAQQPDQAFETAGGWIARGGGPPAQHCQAVALVGLGRYGDAAQKLEALAGDARVKATPLAKAALGQAAQAWLLAGENTRAIAADSAALRLEPNDPDLLVDRSIGYAGAQQYWEAIDDLNRAIELQPKRADAYAFRGAAYRLLESYELAREDVGKALALDPYSPEALLERGILRRLAQDQKGARADWMRVIELAPTSPAADAARINLEKMDVMVP
ncbi:MAG: hypothetical protein HYR63_10530 [Proteobacteria bacterium]|nr:hypothetical protein [Pseudomonadota bacterium]MBI3499358.1 hypothetical protein [Pseudomonadota bacterium]